MRCLGAFLYSNPTHPPTPPPPPPTQQLQDVHAPFVFLNSSYFFFNASIITFSKKKPNFGNKKVTLDPRHGTLALDLEPSTLDPRQKDRLFSEQAFPFSPPPFLLCSRPNFLEDLGRKLLQRRLPAEVLNVMITAVAKNKKVKTVIVQKTEVVLIWWCQQGLEEEECSSAG